MWYQFARLIRVQIALLLGCFYSIAVATIGYVAAMLLVKIEEEDVGGKGEAGKIARKKCCRISATTGFRRNSLPRQEKSRGRRSDPSGGRRHDSADRPQHRMGRRHGQQDRPPDRMDRCHGRPGRPPDQMGRQKPDPAPVPTGPLSRGFRPVARPARPAYRACLLYTSDAADE